MNEFAVAARRKKAEALVAIFRLLEGTAKDARTMSPEDWENAAKLANVKPPSYETIRLVCEMLEQPSEKEMK